MLDNHTVNTYELFNNAPSALLCVTIEGKILEANDAALRLFDMPRDILCTKPLITLVKHDSRRKIASFLHAIQE